MGEQNVMSKERIRRRFPTEETRRKIRETRKLRGAVERITPNNAPIGFFNWRICGWIIEQEIKRGEVT